jgi:hypothetical protein
MYFLQRIQELENEEKHLISVLETIFELSMNDGSPMPSTTITQREW